MLSWKSFTMNFFEHLLRYSISATVEIYFIEDTIKNVSPDPSPPFLLAITCH